MRIGSMGMIIAILVKLWRSYNLAKLGIYEGGCISFIGEVSDLSKAHTCQPML